MKKLLSLTLAAALALTLSSCNKGVSQEESTLGTPKNTSSEPTEKNTSSETTDTKTQYSPVKTSANVGDIIQFGEYDWRVLDVQDGKALLITEDIIEERTYNNAQTSITWENCDLRQYLNGEFYDSFSESDRARIVEVTNKNPDNPEYGTAGGNDTTDKIFLLSIDEAEQYFANDDERIDYGWWWLRSPGGYDCAACVGIDGFVLVYGDLVIYRSGGVRPALWLNLQS